jgi:UDP-N-acetylmuramoylalanine--D-glutamate ligase
MHTYNKALVVGCGRSGRAAEALLRSEGSTVTSICQETTPDYRYEDLPFEPDVAIMSPGFSLEHPWVKDLIARGIPLVSELELGWSRRQCPVIAVTGSNGKSTVVKWIVDALAHTGKVGVACGNYGFPISAAVKMHEMPDWLVVEVSSFQLETCEQLHPDIGVLLNVLPNHLDRHGDMETYRALKLRMFESMQPGSTAILPFGFPLRQSSGQARVGKNAPEFPQSWKTFGTEQGADFRYEDGVVFFENQSVGLRNTYFSNDVLGPAAAAVVAVAEACGVPQGAVTASARQFEPLPHRMERVAEIQGVTFIDDSKATNLAGMCAALRMSSGRIHLIAGGRAKETELSFAKDLLAQQVSRLYLIGEASGAMQTAWADSVECLSCETLERAVFAAWESAEAGDTVLLSPACTSFDQFRSFSERGELFAREVDRLKSK